MNKMIRLSAAAACIAVFCSARAFAEEEVKGKDVVASGTVQILSGTLKPEGNHDWLLITPEGTYELHLGPDKYRESKEFTMIEGQKAEIKGFVFGKHVAPILIKTDKASITLRNEEGRAAWAESEFSRKKGKLPTGI